MAVDSAHRPKQKQSGLSPALVVAVAVAAVLATAGGWYYHWRLTHPAQPAALTPEAKAYTRNLALSGVQMKATEAYAGQQVVEITGTIANNGTRAVKLVEVMCVFYDPYAQVVGRERVAIVRASGGALKPGQSRPFRLAFDELAQSWNQAMPSLVIANIAFE